MAEAERNYADFTELAFGGEPFVALSEDDELLIIPEDEEWHGPRPTCGSSREVYAYSAVLGMGVRILEALMLLDGGGIDPASDRRDVHLLMIDYEDTDMRDVVDLDENIIVEDPSTEEDQGFAAHDRVTHALSAAADERFAFEE